MAMTIGDSSGYKTTLPPIVETENVVRWDYTDNRLYASMFDSQTLFFTPDILVPADETKVTEPVLAVDYETGWNSYGGLIPTLETVEYYGEEVQALKVYTPNVGSDRHYLTHYYDTTTAKNMYEHGGVFRMIGRINPASTTQQQFYVRFNINDIDDSSIPSIRRLATAISAQRNTSNLGQISFYVSGHQSYRPKAMNYNDWFTLEVVVPPKSTTWQLYVNGELLGGFPPDQETFSTSTDVYLYTQGGQYEREYYVKELGAVVNNESTTKVIDSLNDLTVITPNPPMDYTLQIDAPLSKAGNNFNVLAQNVGGKLKIENASGSDNFLLNGSEEQTISIAEPRYIQTVNVTNDENNYQGELRTTKDVENQIIVSPEQYDGEYSTVYRYRWSGSKSSGTELVERGGTVVGGSIIYDYNSYRYFTNGGAESTSLFPYYRSNSDNDISIFVPSSRTTVRGYVDFIRE